MASILCRPASTGQPATEEKHFMWRLDGRKRRKSLTGTWTSLCVHNAGDGDCVFWFGKSDKPPIHLPAKNSLVLDACIIRQLVFKCRAGVKTTIDCAVSRMARKKSPEDR